jgi:ABC-2 type transport system ATP-binding protein
MDEAERCHELAYIAYGKLLAKGSLAEVIAQAKLTTWELQGRDLVPVAERLRAMPGVEMVAAFGNALHASGTDATALAAAVAEVTRGTPVRTQEVPPGLEDAFIHLMSHLGGAARPGA